jgi:hypothetical protein
MVKSVWAVIAGLVTIVLLSIATDVVLEGAKIVPAPHEQTAHPEFFYFFAAYRFLFTILGGFVTAKLAPSAPMNHALILGAIGVALGTAGAIVMWGVGPDWYALSLPISAVPLCWLGAMLAARRAP